MKPSAEGLQTMMDLELRHAKRYPLVAPVNYWWPSTLGAVQGGEGVTRDISSNGVLVATSDCPPVGVHIQMTVFLQRHRSGSHSLELHGEGVVVRVQAKNPPPASDQGAFAASVQFYQELPRDIDPPGNSSSEA